jgi:hypothetical protein
MADKTKGKAVRAPSVKGKKAVDESEKLIVGNGWTIAATQKIMEIPSAEDRIQHLLQMFSISEQDYQYNVRATTMIDFHLSNFLYCTEQEFDCAKTQFACRTMHRMLELATQKSQEDNVNFDALRVQLFEQFQSAFQEWNTGETRFTIEEAKDLIAFVTRVLLRPIRLLIHPFCYETLPAVVMERRKMFRPVRPVPLAECDEVFPIMPESKQFQPFPLPPNVGAMNVEDMKQMIQEYADGVIGVIEKRYDALEETLGRISPALLS